METTPLRSKILDTIIRKSTLKQRVFDNTFAAFNELKETLFEMASEMDDELDGKLDRRVRLEYRDRGKFEAQLQVANDILIFQMHTDVFEFDANHLIWQNPYVQSDRENSYCGLINIYNFLSDSFKFNRNADEGYLIGRIFINRERRYFVEGKQQTSMRAMNFGKAEIDREALIGILEPAIWFALNFDLLMPPYEDNKRVTVDQFNTKMDNSKFVTGKRLGYGTAVGKVDDAVAVSGKLYTRIGCAMVDWLDDIVVIENPLTYGCIFELLPPGIVLPVVLKVDRLIGRNAPTGSCRGVGLLDDRLYLGVGRIFSAEGTGKPFQFLTADITAVAAEFAGIEIAFDDLETQALDQQHRGAVVVMGHGAFAHVFVTDLGPVRQVVALGVPDSAIVFGERIVF